MSLPDIAIRRRVFAWMLMAAFLIFGLISYQRMGVSQLPDIDFPVVTVNVALVGAAPEVMETQVVDPIEDAVMSIQGIRSVTSTAYEGNATITVEFELGRDIDVALQEVQTKVAQAQILLPQDLEPPVVTKTNPEDQPILWLALSSERHTLREMMIYVRDQLKDQFTTVAGVGEVILGGYIEPNMRVWVSERSLSRWELSVNDVIDAIEAEHFEPPSGYLELGPEEANVRTIGEITSAKELESVMISERGGEPSYVSIPLSKVAKVEEGLADIRRISRANGKPSVGLGIRKQRGANSVAVAYQVKKRLEEVAKRLPPGMQLNVNFDSTRFIQDSIDELVVTLSFSALLTALVCWAFLGSWSSTVNVILAIPVSIIGSFLVLQFAGFTLNTFTLLGLTLAIGIVVDDAIMVLENIVRHREQGESRVQAAGRGANEIAFAALAATIAIIAIFLPVAFIRGVIGRFFFEFGVTLSVAVLLSLLEALTFTPMRSASFLEIRPRRTWFGKGMERALDWSRAYYRKILGLALRNRWKVVLGSLVVFFVSLLSVRFLNQEFVPAQDQGMLMVRMRTPPSASIRFTDSRFKLAEEFLSSRPEVARYFAAVGGFLGGEINSGILFVTLKPKEERALSQQQFMDLTRQELNKIPDTKAIVQDLSLRGFTAARGFPLEFAVMGPDWDALAKYSEQIMDRLRETGLVTDLDTDYQAGKTELRIIPNREAAAARGVSVRDIGEAIGALIGGQVVGRYSQRGRRYDIRLRLIEDERGRGDLRWINVRNNRGELVSLADVVRIERKASYPSISRRNRQRAITVSGNIAGGRSQADALAAAESISREILPPGYSIRISGSAETFRESFASLLFVLILGIAVSYMVLASQFNSFIDPVAVLIALPFSISGAFIALALAGQSINIYSLIGLILLMGIAKKNSILLVDFSNRTGNVLEASPQRYRPILMTSVATIAGAIPPALAIGPGAETRIPMAVAVIGGIVLSTLLTLLVVPCVYSLLQPFKRGEARAKELEIKPGKKAA